MITTEIGCSLPARRIIRVLEQQIWQRGKPKRLQCDNGPEFTSDDMRVFCERMDIELVFIQAGKPTQNAYVERFNRTYREDVLDAWLFKNLKEIRRITDE